jgi:predicted membrane-bound dolichyl-phosphate-mannose-protein mannosyltransferase
LQFLSRNDDIDTPSGSELNLESKVETETTEAELFSLRLALLVLSNIRASAASFFVKVDPLVRLLMQVCLLIIAVDFAIFVFLFECYIFSLA